MYLYNSLNLAMEEKSGNTNQNCLQIEQTHLEYLRTVIHTNV